MSENKQKTFIAVAWPYVNGDIHIGHIAGYFLPCDIHARYSRLKGRDTLMVSGTDCHGTPITVAADKKGVTPQDIVDEYDPKVRALVDLYQLSFDIYTSTMTENHEKVTHDFFLTLVKNGYIIKKTTEQYYSEADKKFLPDRYVEGECSYCHAKEQRADQCENCGRMLGAGELINPKSKSTGADVDFKETEHYFIDYPKLQSEIHKFVESSENWREWVKSETLGWINEGLQPRAITRDLDWGFRIPIEEVPDDLKIENAESKRFYVWFDAVIGYVSAAIEWSNNTGKDWKEFWYNPDSKHYYFMGKDNLAFHTIFWPGQLIGQKKNYNLPYFPAINQFLNLEGKKFSKSRGVYIGAAEIVEKYELDQIRFYITSILPESKDANWKWDDFQNTINNELVANIGNFIHRTLVFFKNKLGGEFQTSELRLDSLVQTESHEVFADVSKHMEVCEQVAALNRILKYSKFGNQYFDSQKPWVSIKENREECEKTIFNCLQIVYSLRTLLNPFIPNSTDKLSQILGIEPLNSRENVGEKFIFDNLDVSRIKLAEEFEPLFQKIEEVDKS